MKVVAKGSGVAVSMALVGLLCGATLYLSAPLAAGQLTGDEAVLAGKGRGLFYRYCQNCHGKSGEGDGVTAEFLRVAPTDLTQLAAANDGVFPEDRVARSIDGRERVAGHGSREMPIWGEVLRDDAVEGDQSAVIEGKLAAMLAYVKSLQVAAAE